MKQPKSEQYHEKKRHTEDQFPYNTYLCTIPDDFAEVPVHLSSFRRDLAQFL